MSDSSTAPFRSDLGDFSSIICFRALIMGVEKILGRAAHGTLVSAGKLRGKDLVASLDLDNAGLGDAQNQLSQALGNTGTKLCNVVAVDVSEGEQTVVVSLADTICSASEPQGSERRLTFTLGAMHGAVEALTGKKYTAAQTGSVLRGQDYDIITFTAR